MNDRGFAGFVETSHLSLTHSLTHSPSLAEKQFIQGMTEGVVEVSHYIMQRMCSLARTCSLVEVSHYYMQRNNNHDMSVVGSLV